MEQLKLFQWPVFNIHLPSFVEYLELNLFGFSGLVTSQAGFNVTKVNGVLSQLEEQLVESYILGLSPESEQLKISTDQARKTVKQIVVNSQAFGNTLIVEFATENVLWGITQAGKTKAVTDYLKDVMRYAQSGSLYEVMNEVDRLVAIGIPQELAPFVTLERLGQFRQKIVDYLT